MHLSPCCCIAARRSQVQPLPPPSLNHATTVLRNPHLWNQPQELLQLLCCRHLPLLQARAPAGLPWIMSRLLSPRILALLDSGDMSEILHRVYVYMTSDGLGALDDLHLTLKDMKLGLRSSNLPALAMRPGTASADGVVGGGGGGEKPASVAGGAGAGASAAAAAGGAVEAGAAAAAAAAAAAGDAKRLTRAQLSMVVAGVSGAKRRPSNTPAAAAAGSPSSGAGSRGGTAPAASRPNTSPQRRLGGGGGAAFKPSLLPGWDALETEAAFAPTQFAVPLLRVAQFLRQAGLVPRLLGQLITDLLEVREAPLGTDRLGCNGLIRM